MNYLSERISVPNRGLQYAVLGTGFALLVAVVLACAWLVQLQNENNDDVRRVLELQGRLTKALATLQDAETGQRGFLLTRDENYLAPYRGAQAAFEQEIDRVEKLIVRQERISELRGIRNLATAKFTEMDLTIAQQRAGDRDGAAAIVKSDRGKHLMDQIREMIALMVAFDDRVLKENLAEATQSGRYIQYGTAAAVFLVLLLAIYVMVTTSHSIRSLVALISQRDRAETQIRQMQKMQAVGQLTGGIAHDFNNMLAIIIGSLSLMQKRLARGETNVAQYADAAMEGAQRAATLTSRLLAFSRQQPLMPVTLDLNKTVSGMSELLRRTLGENVHMETVLAGGLWKTHADPGEIENAVLNLCVNARDAMPEGGRLTIETANCFLDDAYSADHPEVPAGQYVLVAVSDTGTGMTKDTMGRAFDPFFTTKPTGKGTGLGLSQVYGFVKQTGGHVKIYSESTQGTTIKVYLPRTHRADVTEQQPLLKIELPKGDSREIIFVVEDDDRVRSISVGALRELGYTVIHAESGPVALEKLKLYPDVKLLFTDIVMPGMNGRVLATHVLKERPNLKVLYTTGYTHNAVVHNGVVDADAQLIVKPYTVDQLALKVRDVLRAE